MMSAFEELNRRISNPESIRRLAQALCMLVGEEVSRTSLIWARGLLGQDGDAILWNCLVERGALSSTNDRLEPGKLCELLCELWLPGKMPAEPGLVWTLPSELGLSDQDSYLRAAVEIIGSAQSTIWLVSPFLESRGVGRLLEALLAALGRRVHVSLIAHGVGSLADMASAALEQLRRDARGTLGRLTVFSVDGAAELLVHSKLIVTDEAKLLIGSANLTDKGFSKNFEAGVKLGPSAAKEALEKIECLVGSNLVHKTFDTTADIFHER
jgi:phosphatidylserine/phosphatidylglycerophosphate/cardiolipin synthase-like enzyme